MKKLELRRRSLRSLDEDAGRKVVGGLTEYCHATDTSATCVCDTIAAFTCFDQDTCQGNYTCYTCATFYCAPTQYSLPQDCGSCDGACATIGAGC
jgi:hypothetical protein